MELINSVLLGIHVTAGFSSLLLFVIPVISRKGGTTHVRIGKIYVKMMWVVVCSALLLSVINLLEKDYFTAAFLGFLSILTSHPLWYGVAILNTRDVRGKTTQLIKRILEYIILVLASINIAAFIYLKGQGQSILLLIFGILGVLVGVSAFKRGNTTTGRKHIIREHISSMITSGIAAYTAFFAFGGYTFFGSLYEGYTIVLFWTLPGILGTIIISYYTRKYYPKPDRVSS